MKILAIDPGHSTGWAIYNSKEDTFSLGSFGVGLYCPHYDAYRMLNFVLTEYPEIDIVAIEEPGKWTRGSRKTKYETIVSIARLQGVFLARAEGDYKSLIRTVNWARNLICPEALGKKRAEAKRLVVANLELRGYVIPLNSRGKPNEDVADAMLLALAVAAEQMALQAAMETHLGQRRMVIERSE